VGSDVEWAIIKLAELCHLPATHSFPAMPSYLPAGRPL
jgi:hypothetical protein